ncbi:MAG: Slp family lipoprotein [Gammaproteobacteria bacterium]|jgi:outer membrane lipoprotein|nr:Slp family lipoprotein [Gammaproteobacteria bacterium]
MLPPPALPLLLLLLLLNACASGPAFNTGGVDRSLTPREVASQPLPAMGRNVLWGGVIIRTRNLKDSTQIEMLAYPLDASERPQPSGTPLGRFILEQRGYLEPASYTEGRQLTVVGTVSGTRAAQIGESDYNYPVITARQLHLWPATFTRDGVGVGGFIGIGTGGGSSWGSGISIGF